MKIMMNIRYMLILFFTFVIYSCNFSQQEKKISQKNDQKSSLEKKIKYDLMLKNVTDSVLSSFYPDSSKSFISEERNLFAVYKYFQKDKNSRIYKEVLKKEFGLDDAEYSSRFKESKLKLNPVGINLDVKIYNDSNIKFNSYPGNQKALLLNEKTKTVSLYFADSLVFSNDRKMFIYINVRDKIFVSSYKYDINKQFFLKINEELYKEIE